MANICLLYVEKIDSRRSPRPADGVSVAALFAGVAVTLSSGDRASPLERQVDK